MRRRNRDGSGRPWFWLVALGLLFVVSAQRSLAPILRDRASGTALALAPDNARVLATVAADTTTRILAARSTAATATDRARAGDQARAALLREPGNVSAAGTLGLLAATGGRAAEARRFFEYVAARSRRDLRTQLWLIEDAVAQGSIPLALEHYDVALRTSRNAPDILFPVLGSAIADPQVRDALAHTFRARPLWREAFEGYLARRTDDFAAAGALFATMARNGTPPSAGSENILLSNMVTANDVDVAWRYYRIRHPRLDPLQPRNAAFSPRGTDGSPFDWSLLNDNGISSSLGNDAGGGALSFGVSPGIAGIVTQQLQRLPAGRYRVSGHSRDIPSEAKGYVHWEVACGDGRMLGRAAVAPSQSAAAPFAADFVVPATNCASQLLRLVVLPNDDVEGVSGEMLDVRFDRQGRP